MGAQCCGAVRDISQFSFFMSVVMGGTLCGWLQGAAA
jgi:hypothetical protein